MPERACVERLVGLHAAEGEVYSPEASEQGPPPAFPVLCSALLIMLTNITGTAIYVALRLPIAVHELSRHMQGAKATHMIHPSEIFSVWQQLRKCGKCVACAEGPVLCPASGSMCPPHQTCHCHLRHDQMEQGPTEPHTRRSTFLLSSGDAGTGGRPGPVLVCDTPSPPPPPPSFER